MQLQRAISFFALLAATDFVLSFSPPLPVTLKSISNAGQPSKTTVAVSISEDDDDFDELTSMDGGVPNSRNEELKGGSNNSVLDGAQGILVKAGLLAVLALVAYNGGVYVLDSAQDMMSGAATSLGDGMVRGAGDLAINVGSAALEGVKVAAPIVGKAVVGASQAVIEAATPYVEEASKQVDVSIVAPIKDAVDSTIVAPMKEVTDSVTNTVDATIQAAADSVSTTVDETIVTPIKDAIDSTIVDPIKDATDSVTNAGKDVLPFGAF